MPGRVADWLRSLARSRPDGLVGLVALAALISGVASAVPRQSFAALLDAVPFLLVFILLRTSSDAPAAAVRATLAAAAVTAGVSLLQVAGLPAVQLGAERQPIGLIGNPNHLATFIVLVMPLLLWRSPTVGESFDRSGRARRGPESEPGSSPGRSSRSGCPRLSLAMCAALLSVLALTRCRGALLALLAATAVTCLAWRMRRRATSMAAVAAVSLAMVVVALVAAPSQTARARALTWRLAARAAAEHPFLGRGPGSFEDTFPVVQARHFDGLADSPERLTAGEWRLARNHRQAHNDFLELVYELGYPAGLLALALLAQALRRDAGGVASRAGMAALAAIGLTSFPLQTPATALVAVLLLALSLPPWRRTERPVYDEAGPVWPKAWIAAACVVLLFRTGATYLSQAEGGRGWRLLEAGKIPEAQAALQRAVGLDPFNGEARATLGRALFAAGNAGQALAALRDAGRDHMDSSILVNQGVVLQRLGRKVEALEQFHAAVEMQPSDSDGWHFLGLALDAAGQTGKALEAQERARGLRVDNHAARLEAARLAQRLGRQDEAEASYQDNVIYLTAKMAEEDPTLGRLDAVMAGYLARNARELDELLEARGKTGSRQELRRQVRRFLGDGGPAEGRE